MNIKCLIHGHAIHYDDATRIKRCTRCKKILQLSKQQKRNREAHRKMVYKDVMARKGKNRKG